MTEERRDQAEQGEGYVGHTDVENEGEQAPPPEPQHLEEGEPEAVQADEPSQDSATAEDTNDFPDEEPQESRFEDGEGEVVQGQPEENVDNTDSTSRAQSQVQAQDQANGGYELEFENRIAPIRDEIQNYRDDLANQGDEAGAAHASHFLDMIIQRFRLPGDVSSPEASQENQEQ